jgi:hypothetical protein
VRAVKDATEEGQEEGGQEEEDRGVEWQQQV